MIEACPGRCPTCPANVLPRTNVGRRISSLFSSEEFYPLPTKEALDSCAGSPDLYTDTLTPDSAMDQLVFGRSRKLVEGICPAEGLYVSAIGSEITLIYEINSKEK